MTIAETTEFENLLLKEYSLEDLLQAIPPQIHGNDRIMYYLEISKRESGSWRIGYDNGHSLFPPVLGYCLHSCASRLVAILVDHGRMKYPLEKKPCRLFGCDAGRKK